MSEKEIIRIVASAFNKLGEKLSKSCIENNYFVTYVTTLENEKAVIIDCEKRMTLNYDKFVQQSQDSYIELNGEPYFRI